MRPAGFDVDAYNHIRIQSAPPCKLSNASRLFKKGFVLLISYGKMRGSLRSHRAIAFERSAQNWCREPPARVNRRPMDGGAAGWLDWVTMRKRLYLANPTAFPPSSGLGRWWRWSRRWKRPAPRVWEPFARNNPVHKTAPGWAYRVGQADLRDVRTADGLFAVVNGCPPTKG